MNDLQKSIKATTENLSKDFFFVLKLNLAKLS